MHAFLAISSRPFPALQVLLVVYPFLWLQLYLFLFKQRAKKLGGERRRNAQKTD